MFDTQIAILLGFLKDIGLTILGIVMALWYSARGAPRLRLRISKPSDIELDNLPARVLHIKVLNEPRKNWPFVSRQTAYACTGTITFLSISKQPLTNPMHIRWQSSPEPLRYEIVDEKIITVAEPRLLRISRFIDIAPDAGEIMDVAVRISDESCAYGWNSDSYFNKWRNPDYKLQAGRYIVRVELHTGDQRFVNHFVLNNVNGVSEFEIKYV